MNKEEIVIYVFATTNEMRECFKTYEHLFDKYSKINCYGILKNGLKIQFTNEIRGLRKIKTYDEIKIYLQEMNNQQENKELKEELEEKNKPQIFIDTQDIEERYAEGLYQDYLEEENKKYKNQQKEFIEYLEKEINIYPNDISDYDYEDIINTILSKYREIIGDDK